MHPSTHNTRGDAIQFHFIRDNEVRWAWVTSLHQHEHRCPSKGSVYFPKRNIDGGQRRGTAGRRPSQHHSSTLKTLCTPHARIFQDTLASRAWCAVAGFFGVNWRGNAEVRAMQRHRGENCKMRFCLRPSDQLYLHSGSCCVVAQQN